MKTYAVIPHPVDKFVIVDEVTRTRWYSDLEPVQVGMSQKDARHLLKSLKAPKLDPDGKTVIRLRYHDGEYLTGYSVSGEGAELLEKIGMARWMSGWGYYVNDDLVKKLGQEFRYQAAVDFAAPALAEKQARKQAAEQARNEKFERASRTGQAVVLDRYTEECNREDCSLDNVTVWAMPDGTTKTTRNHTW